MEGFTDEITPNLRKVVRELQPAARAGLYLGAEHVLGVSNDKVPHEEGDFERGGKASVSDSELVAAVSYRDTGFSGRKSGFSGQAEWLHEDLTVQHDDGRTAKFLENAINSERNDVRRIVASEINRRMGL